MSFQKGEYIMSTFFGTVESGKPVDGPRVLDGTSQEEFKVVRTTSWYQHSSHDDLAKNYYGPPHPGWTIMNETIDFVVEWSQGNRGDQWSEHLISYNPVGYHVKTVHHRIGTSGKVNFHFTYTIKRPKN
jgi:hypothetical protein